MSDKKYVDGMKAEFVVSSEMLKKQSAGMTTLDVDHDGDRVFILTYNYPFDNSVFNKIIKDALAMQIHKIDRACKVEVLK